MKIPVRHFGKDYFFPMTRRNFQVKTNWSGIGKIWMNREQLSLPSLWGTVKCNAAGKKGGAG